MTGVEAGASAGVAALRRSSLPYFPSGIDARGDSGVGVCAVYTRSSTRAQRWHGYRWGRGARSWSVRACFFSAWGWLLRSRGCASLIAAWEEEDRRKVRWETVGCSQPWTWIYILAHVVPAQLEAMHVRGGGELEGGEGGANAPCGCLGTRHVCACAGGYRTVGICAGASRRRVLVHASGRACRHCGRIHIWMATGRGLCDIALSMRPARAWTRRHSFHFFAPGTFLTRRS
jgi:hypothetical protein